MRTASGFLALVLCAAAVPALAQQPAPQAPAQPQPFVAGTPLPVRDNIKTYGSFMFAESVSYDPAGDRYVVANVGVTNAVRPNDGYISILNPDGTVHTLKWIAPTPQNGLTLNDPRGTDIEGGVLYVADNDTVRMFDMATGQPRGAHVVPGAIILNDLEVAPDGTIYVTDTGNADLTTSRVFRITRNGEVSVFATGDKLNRPNGIAFDPQGNIVVVLIATNEVLTYAPSGQLIKVEASTDPGNDGIAILPDGTKYVSSVMRGTIARIRPGQPAETIATDIPNAASMTIDPKRMQLIVPQNQQNAVTIVQLR